MLAATCPPVAIGRLEDALTDDERALTEWWLPTSTLRTLGTLSHPVFRGRSLETRRVPSVGACTRVCGAAPVLTDGSLGLRNSLGRLGFSARACQSIIERMRDGEALALTLAARRAEGLLEELDGELRFDLHEPGGS